MALKKQGATKNTEQKPRNDEKYVRSTKHHWYNFLELGLGKIAVETHLRTTRCTVVLIKAVKNAL